jgi:adenosylcobinamide-GDP ribazoletransferase
VRGRSGGPAVNALRLAFGTLSIIPTRPPDHIDRTVAGRAMSLAPLVALAISLPLWLLVSVGRHHASWVIIAVLWLAGLAVLTRAMHLDGLADTADALGSRKPAADALELMRRGDVGPFGVVTLLLVLLVDLGGAAELLGFQDGPALLTVAVVQSRLIVPLACTVWTPGARPDGLGATVAGSVNVGRLAIGTAIVLVVSVAVPVLADADVGRALAGLIGVGVGWLFLQWCVRRLGGITGDVIGACVEVSLAASLLVLAWH